MSTETSSSTNKRSRMQIDEPVYSSSTNNNNNVIESTSTSIPTYDIHDVIYLLANIGYTKEVKQFVFINSDHYHDERLLSPLYTTRDV